MDTVTTVVIMDPSGNVTARFPTQGRWIAWSPDSTRVAGWDEYARNDRGTMTIPGSIGIYGIDGTRETQIALPPGWRPFGYGQLAWMPDGGSLIVDEYEVPLDGGTPRELPFPHTGAVHQPQRYSPDGSQVAYATRDGLGLMVARPDGSEAREVFGHAPESWTWSPNGELIVLTGTTIPYGANEVHIVDVATGETNLLMRRERFSDFWVIGFSPDGDRVLFGGFEGADDQGTLWSVGVDGSDAHVVVADPTGDGAWRPI